MSIPAVVCRDLGADVGELLSLYRGEIAGRPVAVVANCDLPELDTEAAFRAAVLEGRTQIDPAPAHAMGVAE